MMYENNEVVTEKLSKKKIAREALRGNWRVAILTSFIVAVIGAGFFGGLTTYFLNIFVYGDTFGGLLLTGVSEETIYYIIYYGLMLFCTLITFILCFILGGVCRRGYAVFNLKLIDGTQVSVLDIFSQRRRFKAGFRMNLLVSIYVFLWSLLFIVPGIVKNYSYFATPFILAENPEMKASQAIKESKRIMKGHKGELFGLQMSFIGWAVICVLPVSIFNNFFIADFAAKNPANVLWLILAVFYQFVTTAILATYQHVSYAAFYRNLQAEQAQEAEEST